MFSFNICVLKTLPTECVTLTTLNEITKLPNAKVILTFYLQAHVPCYRFYKVEKQNRFVAPEYPGEKTIRLQSQLAWDAY